MKQTANKIKLNQKNNKFFIKLAWNLVDTKDSCTIHAKIDPDTGLTISRGETTIEKDRDTVIYSFL